LLLTGCGFTRLLPVQKFEVKADASSRDLQDVHTTIVVNFSLDGSKCHEVVKTVGADFGPLTG
jgi:hypothetical protein